MQYKQHKPQQQQQHSQQKQQQQHYSICANTQNSRLLLNGVSAVTANCSCRVVQSLQGGMQNVNG